MDWRGCLSRRRLMHEEGGELYKAAGGLEV